MPRSMRLTLLLMAGSLAAAVAAPQLGLGADPADRAEVRTVEDSARSAAPLKPRNSRNPRNSLIVPVAARADDQASASVPCAFDVTEPYRMWHHGSSKLVAGCGTMSST